MNDLDLVTGAFSYTGRFVAPRLLRRGRQLRTMTNHPDRSSPLYAHVETSALDFERPDRLVEVLRGVDTLYNTYWVRSTHGAASFAQAVQNTRILIDAAVEARVRRIVHVSIANPGKSDMPYYRGKAELETAVRQSGLSYAIIRPTLLFGHGDVLINNIAWFLRHLPVFGIPGDGQYRLQPVFVEDYADRIVEAGAAADNVILDVAGPERFTFEGLVRLLRDAMGRRTRLVRMPPPLALAGARAVSVVLRDITLTSNELTGLMAELLISDEPSSCPSRLSEWVRAHQQELGHRYASEITRHYRLGRGPV
ncbi:MAG TPA: NAD(P)H-binding protein [Candidatus Dormibacteraeota bacterium]